ncbi:MAG: hypothetical protein GF334_13875 [Candidatus Altiarchaeales archaeon]|nr:hypothetical protein [Candidatus Altiarchaeales archaeon]
MSIDTEDKRRSVAGTPPTPDGSVPDDEADRRHVAGLYRGITGAPEEPPSSGSRGLLLMGCGVS